MSVVHVQDLVRMILRFCDAAGSPDSALRLCETMPPLRTFVDHVTLDATFGRRNLFGPDLTDRRVVAEKTLDMEARQALDALCAELAKLDELDFEPGAGAEFVVARHALAARNERAKVEREFNYYVRFTLERLERLILSYRGTGSGGAMRRFPVIADENVRSIVERDYRELSERAFPDGAWKSTVILAGSILEAVLLDVLMQNEPAAMAATSAPLRRGSQSAKRKLSSTDRDDEWNLKQMIDVSAEIGLISPKNVATVHEVLREYRNLVHPRLEIAMGTRISEGHATASKGVLEIILDELERQYAESNLARGVR